MDRKILILSTMIIALTTAGAGCNESTSNSTSNTTSSSLPNPTSTPVPTPTDSATNKLRQVPPTVEEVESLDKIAETKLAVMETDKGTIKFKFYPKDAPFTVASFVKLIQAKYFDGLIFHRVVSGFVIQGGDPTGTGSGGPGYQFKDELNPETASYKEGYVKGVVAMANAGPATNGSQFFIMLKDTPLPHDYTIFGKVVEGQDVVDAIGKVSVDENNDRPLAPVVINKITLE